MKKMMLLVCVLIVVFQQARADDSDVVWSRTIPGSRITDIKLSPDSKYAACCSKWIGTSYNGVLQVYNINDGSLVWGKILPDVYGLAFTNNGKFLISAGRGPKLIVWDALTGDSVKELFGSHPDSKDNYMISSLSISPDGSNILFTALHAIDMYKEYGRIYKYTFADDKVVKLENLNYINPYTVKYSPKGTYVFIEDKNGETSTWSVFDPSDFKRLFTAKNYYNYPGSVLDVTQDESLFLTAGVEHEAGNVIYSMPDFKIQKEFRHISGHQGASFCKNNAYIILYRNNSGDIQIYNWIDSSLIYNYKKIVSMMGNCYFTNDDKFILIKESQDLKLLKNGLLNVSVFESSNKESIIYPSPTDNIARISLNIPNGNNFQLNIFDSNSNLITNLYSGQISNGEHIFDWDTKPYPNGEYFCRVEMPHSVFVLKIIVNK